MRVQIGLPEQSWVKIEVDDEIVQDLAPFARFFRGWMDIQEAMACNGTAQSQCTNPHCSERLNPKPLFK